MRFFFLALFFLMSSCNPSTLSEWRVEGVCIVKTLVEELEKIQSLEDLKRSSSSIKKKYNKLVEVMIEAEKWQEQEGDFHPESFYSEALCREYIRLYSIEGCKELLFSLQKDGLHKLDRALAKK